VSNAILDKKQLGNGYEFIQTPVWYSATVNVPEGTTEAVSKLMKNFYTVQSWLDTVYEAARVGVDTPVMPDEIKEILWPADSATAKQASEKQPKKRATAAASSTESPKA
jgi:hypothetical protein